jgi:hypothetical protein
MSVVKGKSDAGLPVGTATADGTAFLKERLGAPGKRRGRIEESLAALETAIGEVERDMVCPDLVARASADLTGVFLEIKRYQQKELMRLVYHKAILGPDYLKTGLYGRPLGLQPPSKEEPRSQAFGSLPGRYVHLPGDCAVSFFHNKRDIISLPPACSTSLLHACSADSIQAIS